MSDSSSASTEDYDFVQLRKAYGTDCSPSRLHTYHALDWNGCIRKASEHPVFVGSYSELFMGCWDGTISPHNRPPPIIIKEVRMLPDDFHDAKALNRKKLRLKQEVDVWQRVSHPNVLPFVGITTFPGRLPSLIFVFMEQGTVKNFLRKHPTTDRTKIILGITNGLTYLHSFNPAIIHGDMKADNVLVDEKGNPRLADFGLSKVKDEIMIHTTNRYQAPGTTRWMAPELLTKELSVTTEGDVWAYAMTSLEIMTGQVPFHKLNTPGVIVAVALHNKIPERPASYLVPEELWTIWQRCWSKSPSDRPSMQVVSQQMVEFAESASFDATVALPYDRIQDDLDLSSMSSPVEKLANPFDRPDFESAALKYDYTVLWRTILCDNGTVCPVEGAPFIPNWTGFIKRLDDKCIGWGGFCDILMGEWTNVPPVLLELPPAVAIKVCRLSLLDDERRRRMAKAVARQLRVWSKLKHPNVLPLLGIVMDCGTFPATISPMMINGEALKYLKAVPNARKAYFLLQLARGIQYLHDQTPSIIHGGIKASNVLVDEDGQPRLSGFALSRQLEETTSSTSVVGGYVRWMSPELIFGDETSITIPGDVYSYAMTSWEIFTGEIPFSQTRSESQVIVLVWAKGERPTKPFYTNAGEVAQKAWEEYTGMPLKSRPPRKDVHEKVEASWAREEAENELWQLWEKCWAQDPTSRPDMHEVVTRMEAIGQMDKSF